MRRNEDDVVINIATRIRIIDAEDVALVVLADVVPHYDIGVLLYGAHPEQTVAVIMAITVLENTVRAFEVRVVQASVIIPRPVEVSLVELEDRAAAAAREDCVAGAGAICCVPADVVFHDAAVR
ncbi:MAG: hypothetical protein CEE38_05105 [Planctomycetes bacterium B3_Pla]|nr:MAG: hypothetical protein CEE38_05105 [Planctomycetes bacterium B3_Pla]